MTPKEAIECLKNEKLCILIADKNECTRECSNCGACWTCIEGDPADNDMHFCPVCGAEIEKVVE